MDVWILFILFGVLIVLAVPVGYAIGISTLVCLIAFTDINPIMIAQNCIAGVNSFSLMAIPFFILAGNLMSKGGLAKRLIDFADVCVGAITGGLAMVTTVACMFFAALSGSAVATTSAIGSFMIPEMKKHNYDEGFAAALAAAAGTIGIIIPPSIPLVLYGVSVGASIGSLFKAALLPGVLMGIMLMIACYFIAKKNNYKGESVQFTWKLFFTRFKDAFFALLAPGIILGGIYTGVCTPTEAAVLAVLYSLIVGKFVYKELTWKKIWESFADSMHINGNTTFMVGVSMAFAAYLAYGGVPMKIANAMLALTDSKTVMFLLINVFLLIVGSLIDPVPAIIILSPILLPIVKEFGMDAITFGVVLICNLAIGYITPPYGVNLFVAMAVSRLPMNRLMKYVWILFLAMLAAQLLITFVPFITTALL